MTRLTMVMRLLAPRWRLSPWGLVAAALGVSTLQALYILYIRREHGVTPPSWLSLTQLNLNPYTVGLAVQELIIPVALVFLLSSSPAFKRLARSEARRRDRWFLFAALAFMQALFFVYIFALEAIEISQITRGGLIVLIAGFLGGPWVGGGVGVLTWALMGVRGLVYWPPSETANVSTIFHWHFWLNQEASSLVWLGVTAGLIALLLGRQRFGPSVALVVGIVLGVLSRYVTALSLSDPTYFLAPLVPVVVVMGVALAIVALIVRNVQALAAQQRAQISELSLTQAELRALRAQINPHFLFNSLNTIRYFVRTEPDTARRLLLSLSEVFQRALKSGELISLGDEINYVEAYLELEQARLGERLQVVWSIPDKSVLETLVPTLTLQPVVENAVIHGVSKKAAGGEVTIMVERWGSDLVVQVRDDGQGFGAAELQTSLELGKHRKRDGRERIGLANINHRLRMLYGEAYRLLIESEPGSGTRVQLKIPLSKNVSARATPQPGVTPALAPANKTAKGFAALESNPRTPNSRDPNPRDSNSRDSNSHDPNPRDPSPRASSDTAFRAGTTEPSGGIRSLRSDV